MEELRRRSEDSLALGNFDVEEEDEPTVDKSRQVPLCSEMGAWMSGVHFGSWTPLKRQSKNGELQEFARGLLRKAIDTRPAAQRSELFMVVFDWYCCTIQRVQHCYPKGKVMEDTTERTSALVLGSQFFWFAMLMTWQVASAAGIYSSMLFPSGALISCDMNLYCIERGIYWIFVRRMTRAAGDG